MLISALSKIFAPAWSRIFSMCWEAVRPRDSFAWVMRLQMKTRVAWAAPSASGMPSTSRLVTMLV